MPVNHSVRGSARLIQVTDTHLFAEPSTVLLGLNCRESLQDVLELVKQKEQDFAAFLCTGDLSQDRSAASYQWLEQNLAAFGVPQYWIPGNHDGPVAMQAALGSDHPSFTRAFTAGNWRVILLDSSVAEQISGHLAARELASLEQELEAASSGHVLVCLHHNPVPVVSGWLQKHALQNSHDLFALLARYPAVRLIVCGHVHQDLQVLKHGITCIASPSTCIQFHPQSQEFRLDTLNPGYRWLDLHADGSFQTGVNRVPDKVYNIDFSDSHY